MTSIEPVVNAFLELRKRGVVDPIYCRLVLPHRPMDRPTMGWLWRDPARSHRELSSGETFVLSLPGSTDVEITWIFPFNAELKGEKRARQYAIWFLEKGPIVSGGTHLTLDDFEFGPSSWDRVAEDFHLVRCGWYERDSEQLWRHPSEDARKWVRNPNLFVTSENVRNRVIRALDNPLPSGEWVTIRRIFYEEFEPGTG